MKHLQLIYIAIFLSVFTGQSQTTKKVLFIGNSYTSVNNLPSLIQNMATSTGDVLIYDSNTPGGYRLRDHAANATTLSKIKSNNWDYVVLQAQSQETSWAQSQMEAELYPYAEALCQAIRENDDCSQPMFYMTWGRENGDASNCVHIPWVCTYEGMDDAIAATYTFMSETNKAEVTPVGAVWRYIRTNHPELQLYSGDSSHPSAIGSYAAACAFYTMIYKKDPTLLTWNYNLSDTDAEIVKKAAKVVAFDKIADWDFTVNPAVADFSEIINNNQVSFTCASTNFDTLLWDFGDGNSSTQVNPIHTYAAIGNYNVSFTVTKCGKSDTRTKTIHIITVGIQDVEWQNVSISPNPVSDNLTIHLNRHYKNIVLHFFDVSGKSVLQSSVQNANGVTVDLAFLNSGIYWMKLYADNEIFTSKIAKK